MLPLKVIYLIMQTGSHLYLALLLLLVHVKSTDILCLHQSISGFDFNKLSPFSSVDGLSMFVLANLCPELLSIHVLLLFSHQLEFFEVLELRRLLEVPIVVGCLSMCIYHL